jgi:hypothetical protein
LGHKIKDKGEGIKDIEEEIWDTVHGTREKGCISNGSKIFDKGERKKDTGHGTQNRYFVTLKNLISTLPNNTDYHIILSNMRFTELDFYG